MTSRSDHSECFHSSHHYSSLLQGAVAAALARGATGSVGRVVSSPQVSRVTYSAPQTLALSPVVTSTGAGLSRGSADIVTSVLNTLSPTIQRAVARYY